MNIDVNFVVFLLCLVLIDVSFFLVPDSIESLERCRKFLTFGLESGGILLLRRYRVLMDRCSNLNSLLSMEHECFSLPKTVNALVQKYSRSLIYYQDSCVE